MIQTKHDNKLKLTDMKRILTLIAMIGIFFGAWADRPVATVSHEGKLTFFTSGTCFAEAVAAAVDGDIVYLSEGNFITDGLSDATIVKNISITGNGRNTEIVGDLRIGDASHSVNLTFDGVSLDNLTVYASVKKIELKKCRIESLNVTDGTPRSVSVRVDRCQIAQFMGNYDSYEVFNSKISTLRAVAKSVNDAWLYNCHIGVVTGALANYESSIIGSNTNASDNIWAENCIVGPLEGSGHKMTNCWMKTTSVLDENLDCTIDLNAGSYLGKDGTLIGLYGGQWHPYSETPSLPSVDMAKTTFVIDKASNKLKVKVAVTQP